MNITTAQQAVHEAGAILALTDAGWGAVGAMVVALITIVPACAAMFVRQGRSLKAITEIGRAVNHQGPDEYGNEKPTLIARMVTVEKRTEEIAAETARHREWECKVLGLLANELGVELPAHEALSDDTHPHTHA